MSLRSKTLVAMTLLLISLIVLLYVALRQIIISGFETVEYTEIEGEWSRAEALLNGQRESVFLRLSDWSSWTAMHDFISTGDPAFAAENFAPDSLAPLQIDLMAAFSPEQEAVAWVSSDPSLTIATLSEGGEDGSTLLDRALASKATAFYAVIGGTPAIVAVREVLLSGGSGNGNGCLLWVRLLDAAAINQVAALLQLELSLVAHPPGSSAPHSLTTSPTQISRSGVLPADGGDLLLMVSRFRQIFTQAETSVLQFAAAMLLFGAAVTAGAALLIDSFALRRIEHISAAIKSLGRPNRTGRLIVDGNDELTGLSIAVNEMLASVESGQSELERLNADLEARVIARTAELGAQEAQLRAILDTMGEGLVYNVNGNMALMNAALLNMAGYSAEELHMMPFRTLLTKPETVNTIDLKSRADRFETQLIRKDGKLVDVALTSNPLPNIDGNPRRVIIVRDITRERAMQRQRDYFFARASHELRTPLSNIMTRLYLLQRDTANSAHHIEVLDKVSRTMLTLLNDLLDVARLETGIAIKKQPLDLAQVAREVAEVQRPDAEFKHITLLLKHPAAPIQVFADPTRITQALTNLVRNAVLYTPVSGMIVLEVAADAETNMARVSVENTGAGILPEHLPHLFEPFYRVNEGGVGAGLGLFITREIIDLHAGQIIAESVPDQHTRFTITLDSYSA